MDYTVSIPCMRAKWNNGYDATVLKALEGCRYGTVANGNEARKETPTDGRTVLVIRELKWYRSFLKAEATPLISLFSIELARTEHAGIVWKKKGSRFFNG